LPDYSVGSASIKISPSFLGFADKARTELNKMDLTADARLVLKTAEADADYQAFAKQERSTDLRVDLDANDARTGLDEVSRARVAEIEARILAKEAAQANLDEISKARIAEVTARILAKEAAQASLDEVTKARIAQIEARASGVAAVQAQLAELARTRTARIQALLDNSNAARAKGDFDKLVSGLKSASSLNLKVTGVVGAAGVISQILAIGEAAAQAAHLVALIPAGGFAGLAGIGSVATGIHGIPAAFKAINSASDNPTETANKQRDALDTVSNAEYNATQADKKLGDAYRESTRQIRDMNDSLQDQKFAVEDASLSVEDAAKNLQKVNLDPLSDSTTRKRALLDYQEAVQRQKEAGEKLQDQAQDTATANAKGVAGSDQVVEAIHAQTVAQQELAKAQAAAAAGSGSGSKVNDALAKLSPNAKELVADLRAVGPAWHDAQQAGQDVLTGGLGSSIQQLARADLPAAKDGIVGINTAINGGLRSSIALLTTQGAKNEFATSMNNAAGAFKNASAAAEPLTDAVLKLITIGSQDLPGLGTAVTNIANRFDNLIQRTSADGSLKKWIDDGITSAKELAQTAEHVGSSIASIFRAAGDNGQTLKSIDDLSAKMAAFLKSTEGQSELRDFFTQARGDLDKIKPVLADIPDLLKGVWSGFQTWSGIALPFLKAAGDLLSAHPGLVRDIVVAYLAFKTVNPLIDGLTAGWKNVSNAADEFKTKLNGAKTATKEIADEAAATAGEKGVGKLSGAVGGLGKILSSAGPLGIGAITTGIGLGLDYLANQHQKAADAARAQQEQEEQLQATLDKETGAVTQATQEQASKDLQTSGFFDRAKSFGIDPHTYLQASLGLADSDKTAINQQLTSTITSGLSKDSFYKDQVQYFANNAGLSNTDVAQALQGIPDAVKKYTEAAKTTSLPDLAQLKAGLDTVSESAATLGGKMNGYSTDVGTAADKQRELNAAINGSFQITDGAKQKFDSLGVAVQNVPDAKTVIIKDTSDQVKQQLQDLGFTIEKLPDGTVKLTANTGPALTDIQQVTTAPYVAKVKVEVDDSAYKPFTQSLSVNTLKALHGDSVPAAPGRADGGPVYGPGTDSSDSIMMRLSNGEYVINADAVRKYGMGLMDAINSETYQPVSAQIATPAPASTSPGTPAAPASAATATPGAATPSPVVNPQVPLPSAMSDQQIEVVQDRAAVDAANSERNAVYADPKSTAADKQAEDFKYRKAANAYGQALQQQGSGEGGAATLLSAQGAGQALGIGLGSVIGAGIGAAVTGGQGQVANAEFGGAFGAQTGGKLGQILGGGILGMLGLDNSILSSTNSWNQALQKGVAAAGAGGPGNTLGYQYQPQNLPSVPGQTDGASAVGAASLSSTSTGTAGSGTAGQINPDLGTIGTLSVSTPSASYNPSAGVEQWRPLAASILQKEGFSPTDSNVNLMLAQIRTESGGNPTAINNWDSNAAAGHPSQGILQTIPSTFATYRDPSLPNDINDPAANMAAALRYYRATYGNDLSTQWGQGHGYDQGGIASGIGVMLKQTIRPERVLSPKQTETFDSALPLLESINNSAWSPNRIDSSSLSPATAPQSAGAGRTFAPTINARVADVSDLAELVQRQAEKDAIGLMAAMPK
jgi:SLT domain-containing protein/DNA polymerase III delta prime subunit